MTEKKKVIVNINNQDYTVVSTEAEEYIKKIARYVDENIKEMLDKNSKLSNTMATVLSAFNIADRYYKKSEKLNEIKENVLEPLRELETVKSKLKEYESKEASIKKESEAKIESLSSQNELMKNEIEKLKRELEQASKKNKKYENAIEVKDKDLSSNQKVINDLQDKIFEHQMELMQTKKQLEESLKTLEEK